MVVAIASAAALAVSSRDRGSADEKARTVTSLLENMYICIYIYIYTPYILLLLLLLLIIIIIIIYDILIIRAIIIVITIMMICYSKPEVVSDSADTTFQTIHQTHVEYLKRARAYDTAVMKVSTTEQVFLLVSCTGATAHLSTSMQQ